MIPNFVLIIGAMKSGTTTLYDYLAQHPQIAACDEKEPGFFAFEEHWALGLGWYESKFAYDASRHRYAVDASTDYSKYPFCKDVVDRLKASAPRRFKLIYIMRHPLRRIESHARHVQRFKREIGRCLSPRVSHSLDAGISPISAAISRYAYQIDRYSEYFDRGDLLLLTLEHLARDPNTVFAKVCSFLGIDSVPLSDSLLKSNTAESKSEPGSLALGFNRLWWAAHNSQMLHGLAKRIVPENVRASVYRVAQKGAPLQGRFHLIPDETKTVLATLAPDLMRLRDRYGIDAAKEWSINLPAGRYAASS
jgi:hypothetical protein